MPIIEGEPRGKHSPIKFEIDTETRELLRLYCKFSNNKKYDRVIIGALKHLFKTDAEFVTWLERHNHHGSSTGMAIAPAQPSSGSSSAMTAMPTATTNRESSAKRQLL